MDCYDQPCILCGWTAGHASSSSLEDIIHRYAEVAESVNRREFIRFAEEIRKLWDPLPAAKEESDEGYRGEGWTDEGAFALCVYEQAIDPNGCYAPSRHGPLCEAETRNQVLFRPLSSLIQHVIDGPIHEPQSHEKISEALARLEVALQRQANETSPSEAITVELPVDLEDLLCVTDGIDGAGVPSETANTYLVDGLGNLKVDPGKPGGTTAIFWRHDWITYAACKLGGCTQHRQIYYVLCRDAHNDAAPISWKIFDRDDVELDVYDNLAEFISHQTDHIEKRAGGHQQEHSIYRGRYPTYD